VPSGALWAVDAACAKKCGLSTAGAAAAASTGNRKLL
jgi:hypothetical protein